MDGARKTGPAVLARLSRDELTASVADLVRVGGDPGSFIRPLDRNGYIGVSDPIADPETQLGYLLAAEKIAQQALQTVPELADASKLGDPVYVRAFLASLGTRAFRRPMTPTEVDETFKLYTKGAAFGPAEGVVWALTAIFGSPHFIYRIELGLPQRAEGDLVPLSPFERASRLSYFLTGSTPDAELMAVASQNQLGDAAQLERQARRLIATDASRRRMNTFFRQWLRIESADANIEERLRSFDPLSPTVVTDLRASFTRMVDQAGTGFADLFTSPRFHVNRTLARSWGVAGTFGVDYTPVRLDAELRTGVLGHPAFLAANASDGFASASIRGKLLSDRVTCTPIPSPSDDLFDLFPRITRPLATDRKTLEVLHSNSGTCAACHKALDPLGFAFENFDRRGRFRATQGTTPIDSSGEVTLDGKSWPYRNAPEFSAILARSATVSACLARQVFRFALDRHEDAATDGCSIERQLAGWQKSGGGLPDLFVALTTTDAFLYVRKQP